MQAQADGGKGRAGVDDARLAVTVRPPCDTDARLKLEQVRAVYVHVSFARVTPTKASALCTAAIAANVDALYASAGNRGRPAQGTVHLAPRVRRELKV